MDVAKAKKFSLRLRCKIDTHFSWCYFQGRNTARHAKEKKARRHPEGAERLKDPPDYAVDASGDSSLRSCLAIFRMTSKNGTFVNYELK